MTYPNLSSGNSIITEQETNLNANTKTPGFDLSVKLQSNVDLLACKTV